MITHIRNSLVAAYSNCEYSTHLQYVMGIKREIEPVNFLIGNALDLAIEHFLESESASEGKELGHDVLETGFTAGTSMPKNWSMEEYRELLTMWVDKFADYWASTSGRYKVIGTQLRLKAKLPKSHLFATGTLDVLLEDTVDNVYLIRDTKSTAVAYDEDYPLVAGQLHTYHYLVDKNRAMLGLDADKPIELGFFEFTKHKPNGRTGPQLIVTEPVTASKQDVADICERFIRVGHAINSNRPLRANNFHAYNSPCNMCDFKDLCLHNDKEGLVFPEQEEKQAA